MLKRKIMYNHIVGRKMDVPYQKLFDVPIVSKTKN